MPAFVTCGPCTNLIGCSTRNPCDVDAPLYADSSAAAAASAMNPGITVHFFLTVISVGREGEFWSGLRTYVILRKSVSDRFLQARSMTGTVFVRKCNTPLWRRAITGTAAASHDRISRNGSPCPVRFRALAKAAAAIRPPSAKSAGRTDSARRPGAGRSGRGTAASVGGGHHELHARRARPDGADQRARNGLPAGPTASESHRRPEPVRQG